MLAGFTIYPTADTNPGSLRVLLSPDNLRKLFTAPIEECEAFAKNVQALGQAEKGWPDWFATSFRTLDEVQEFDRRYRDFVAKWRTAALDPAADGAQP